MYTLICTLFYHLNLKYYMYQANTRITILPHSIDVMVDVEIEISLATAWCRHIFWGIM